MLKVMAERERAAEKVEFAVPLNLNFEDCLPVKVKVKVKVNVNVRKVKRTRSILWNSTNLKGLLAILIMR